MPDHNPLEIWRERLAFLQVQEALKSDAAQRFELQQQIEEAKTKVAELEKDREHCISGSLPTSPAHSVFALPGTHRPNPHFTPLPEVDAALDALRPGDVLVLYGLGGVGKTQHAVQYAHEQRNRYRQILWASAESEQILRDALAALAELPEFALSVETGFASVEKIRALRRWFENTEDWLLILDNADSPEAARAVERLLPPAHSGYVIITARVAEWTPAFRLQRTDAWADAQSVTFLSKRLAERSPAPGDLARLAQALGGLPLALEHAAAYICETHVAVDEYLHLLAKDRKTLLARHYPGMTDYRASVVTTWHVTIRVSVSFPVMFSTLPRAFPQIRFRGASSTTSSPMHWLIIPTNSSN